MRMSPTVVVPGVAVLALLVLIVLAALDVRASTPKPGVDAVARAYFEFGYARGQQDVLEGATIVGQADQYKLPPVTREQLLAWREARQKATATLEAAR